MPLENGCFWVSDRARISQTIEVIHSLRKLNFNGKCGLCLINELSKNEYAKLKKLDVECIIPKKGRIWPPSFPQTGFKFWIPLFFNCKNYIIIDSDIIIINLNFIKNFQREPRKFKIVREADIFWQYGIDGITAYHKELIGKNVLQTGILGFSKIDWKSFFYKIVEIMKVEPSEHSDMVAINMYLYNNVSKVLMLGEENNLVLRPTGKGIGTRKHLPYVQLRNGKIYYKDKVVSTIHYTKSNGKVVRMQELIGKLSLIKNNETY